MLNEKGRSALDASDLADAERLFMESIELAPLRAATWFNLGLVYKRRHLWPEAAACNARSLDLEADAQDPAYWNLGIAATALGDWAAARAAWEGFGITIESGEGPIDADFGTSPVRINPETTGEVVWGRRLDPARIKIESIPLPTSGHRWHDIILHDGVPVGERIVDDRTYQVFDELERLVASETPTWECLVASPPDALADLDASLTAAGWAMEDWTSSVRRLCDECSRGSVTDHTHGPFSSGTDGHHVGIAAPREAAERLVDEWLGGGDTRSVSGLVQAG